MDTPPLPPNTIPTFDDESRKKYIRTFAGDMEILKKGGTPDLLPLEKEKKPVPTEASVPPAPATTPVPAPPPVPAPAKIPPLQPVRPVPQEPPPPPPKPVKPPAPIQHAEPAPSPEINLSPLKTYAGDFLDKIKNVRASAASVLAAQQDAGGAPEADQPAPSRLKGILQIAGGVLLLLLGGTGVYLGYAHYQVKTAPVILAPVISTPILVDEKENVSGVTSVDVLNAVMQSLSRSPAPGAVRFLYTDTSTTTGNSVFSALQIPAPDVLLRNIVAPRSMAGIVNMAGVSSPFFILSVTSYPDTFAGMLSWERTMLADVSSLFPAYPVPEVLAPPPPPPVATTTATTTPKKGTKTATSTPVVATSTPPAPVPIASFRDEVINNHDARVYRDSLGHSVVIYGYWDKTTLVIARDPDAFTEILGRLATSYSP